MLSLFPQLLFLAPIGTTILRVAAGLCITYAAYRVAGDRDRFQSVRFPLIGRAPLWLIYLGAFLTFAIGVLLVIGLYTQAAAILGALASIKIAVFNKKYPGLMPLSTGAALLLFTICLSLVVSGPGLFAFDLPL